MKCENAKKYKKRHKCPKQALIGVKWVRKITVIGLEMVIQVRLNLMGFNFCKKKAYAFHNFLGNPWGKTKVSMLGYFNFNFSSRRKGQRNIVDPDKDNLPIIFCRISYAGAQGDRLPKKLTKKLKRIISKPFILKNIYKTTKMSYYCNAKDRIPDYLKSHVV